ncbi:hypothetical protein [Bifidobacterium moukalabense]|uniref:hypothetical protein n=1 Tax=Bifidobacterium moukalabense TaxID=1333651 RepID=UPI00148519BC|nr:hypothetical protein [Bifidobacterium moukalabense]
MSYTPERFMKDNGISFEEVAAAKERLLEEAHLFGIEETSKPRHPNRKQLADDDISED